MTEFLSSIAASLAAHALACILCTGCGWCWGVVARKGRDEL